MKFFVSLLSLAILVSCQDIKGNLEVSKNLTLQSQNGAEQIIEGKYSGSVKFTKKKMVLTLDQMGDSEFTFKIPKGTDIPDNGTISLSADEVGQPYDVSGVVATKITRGDIEESWESCTYQQPYTVCRTDARGNRTCWTEYRTVFGRQYVRYYMETVDKDFNMSLLDAGDSVAVFAGKDIARYRRDIYSDQCR
ncbi:MAG: hypothetical protein Fur0010_11550 [Bdellovibrio sp.]